MNPITTGSLVKIVDAFDHLAGLDKVIAKSGVFGFTGQTGIVLSGYEHRSATCGRAWYTVMIQGIPKAFREDYLEVA